MTKRNSTALLAAAWHMMARHGRSRGDPTYSALQILSERFARGEIQKQEYEETEAVILAGGPP